MARYSSLVVESEIGVIESWGSLLIALPDTVLVLEMFNRQNHCSCTELRICDRQRHLFLIFDRIQQ